MLTNIDIIQDGHPTLRLKAALVKLPLSNENLNTLRLMMEYIENSQNHEMVEKYSLRPSVGLAAPQINQSLKMFCMKTYDESMSKLHQYAVVNPKIISHSEEMTYLPGGEGCLSVDEDTTGLVKRAKRIKARVNLVNLETGEVKETTLKLSGYPSIVFQHEFDHLMGILFIDKISETLPDIEPITFKTEEDL
jgi:peptide deformylase